MKNSLIIIFLFALITSGFSQENREIINGTILHFEKPIADVHILNLNTKQGATSDKNGDFQLFMKQNDTLEISHLEFKTKKITINQKLIAKNHITISLEIMTNYLNTVNIKNHNLTGDLFKDTKNTPKDSVEIKMNSLEDEFMKLAQMPTF